MINDEIKYPRIIILKNYLDMDNVFKNYHSNLSKIQCDYSIQHCSLTQEFDNKTYNCFVYGKR